MDKAEKEESGLAEDVVSIRVFIFVRSGSLRR
jgi:hypothetical protein